MQVEKKPCLPSQSIWIHVQLCLHVNFFFIALPLLLPVIPPVFVYVFYPFFLLLS